MAERDNSEIIMDIDNRGFILGNWLILLINWLWFIVLNIKPAFINKSALKIAWLHKWLNAIFFIFIERDNIIRLKWFKVDKAIIFLISGWIAALTLDKNKEIEDDAINTTIEGLVIKG